MDGFMLIFHPSALAVVFHTVYFTIFWQHNHNAVTSSAAAIDLSMS